MSTKKKTAKKKVATENTEQVGESPDVAIETTEKTLNVTNIEEAKKSVNDIEVFGNGDLWRLLSKASSKSQGWMKSTKAMELYNGCLVQVTTQQYDEIAEALQFVPNVVIGEDENGHPQLVSKTSTMK